MGYKRILLYFLSWRIGLLVIVAFAPIFFELQRNFLGGGLSNYLQNPLFWAWANFDGEHYLAIAQEGYKPLTYFFFPLYPILIGLVTKLLNSSTHSYLYSGLFISHISFLIGLMGLIRLVKFDYKENIAKWTVLLLLLFPTSFYFGSVYTESFFFALSVWSFYFAKKDKFILAGVLGAFSTATRIFGLALIPALLFEYLQKKKKSPPIIYFIGIAVIPIGLLSYMYYLNMTVGDPLAFFHNLSIFGEQRAEGLVLFPQVFYRYFFKVIPAINFNYFPIVFTTFLELITASIFLVFIALMFYKKMWTYAIYSLMAYLLATLSGSFSSFPRYGLSIFPVFIILSLWIDNLNKALKVVALIAMLTGLAISTMLFTRGYWVS